MNLTLKAVAAILATSLVVSCSEKSHDQHSPEPKVIHHSIANADEAIAELKAGNSRYVAGNMINTDYKHQREETKNDQHPFTVLLSCMDSRVPPEIVFDQGIGNIFVTRVAGNIEDYNILGSIEYATKVKDAKLIVVMWHSHCGAVKGAIDSVKLGHLTQLVNQITPVTEEEAVSKEDAVNATAKNNVKTTIADILQKSEIVSDLVKQGKVKIVGAYYDVATGIVQFLE